MNQNSNEVGGAKNKADQSNAAIRYLAFILRHRPHEAKIKLNDAGWAEISKLSEAMAKFKKIKMSVEEIVALVQAKSKNSFTISEDGATMKAKSGHTVLLGFVEAAKVPDTLFVHIPKEQITSVFVNGLTMKPGEILVERMDKSPSPGMVLTTIHTNKALKAKTKFYIKDNTYFAFQIPSNCLVFSSF